MKLKLYFVLLFLISKSFLAQSNYYWVGGAGSWNDLNHWRIGSTSGQAATIIPSRYDNVYITSGSGFPAAGGTLTIPSTATCKDFIIDDSFTNKLNFPAGSVFNIYGNLKWKSNAGAFYNMTMNLFSDSSDPTPNLIDIPGNMIDPNYVYISYISYLNLKGNGTFKLAKNFASNGYFQFSISDSAFLDTDNKDISTYQFVYSSATPSKLGTSSLTGHTATLNASADLTQSTLSFSNTTIQTSQDIKKILLPAVAGYVQISGGSLLKVDEILGTGTTGGNISGNEFNINKINIYAYSVNAVLFKANEMIAGDGVFDASGTRYEIKKLTLGKGNNVFRAQQFNIDHLILNGGQYNFRQNQNTTPNYFQVNQTLIANTPCNGTMPRFGGVDSPTSVNLIIPGTINGNGIASFTDYNMSNVKLTGGASATAGINGGNNTGNITYPGIASKTFYWIGGGGDWNDPAHWSFSSGGPSSNCVPIMYDDVIFNADSGFIPGNNTIKNTTGVSVKNMTWNNAPSNPILNTTTSVYGNLYLQKEMTVSGTFNIIKYSGNDPMVNRYMNFEGQKIAQLAISGNDNFYLLPASNPSPYDLEVSSTLNFDNSARVANLYADGRKIKAGEFWLGGNSVSIDNALVRATTLNIITKQTINAPNSAVYTVNYNGRYNSQGNSNHFLGSIYKEGTTIGDIQFMNTGTFQVNAGDIRFYYTNKAANVAFNADSNITMIDSYTKWTVTDSFVYPHADCSLLLNFTGQGGNNLILGNNINGNGFVELNRMNITGINASYITPVAGSKPVNANNSIDNGNNSGINFTIPASKNFYWKGGSGNWNDINHWSLDPSSTRTTSNCGLPTVNDNVFFDQYSGFSTGNITGIMLTNDVSVNDITFSSFPTNTRSYFAGNNNYYKISVNGNAVLHAGYYDAGYFSGFNFINVNKPAGINKSVTPNGATSSLSFTGNATWKINRGSTQYDLANSSSIIQNNVAGNILDISGTVMNLNTMTLNGTRLLMDNADITVNAGINVDTVQPVTNTANSVLKLFKPYGGSGSDISFNNLNHYFEKIEFTNSSAAGDYSINFSFQGGIINHFIIRSAPASRLDKVNPSIIFKSATTVNNLTIEKNNYIALDANFQVNQSLLMSGDCIDRLTFASSNSQPKSLVLPNYSSNPSNYMIDRVQFKMISSSGGQTYTASKSMDLGGNTGISFTDTTVSAPRNLYWIGGQGEWRDPQHWSLSSGGIAITNCDIPTSIDHVFFDQNSGFTPALNKIFIKGSNLSKANNVTFNNVPNQPVIDFGTDGGNPYYLNVYGNLTLQSDLKVVVPMSAYGLTRNIIMPQGPSTGRTRYIDTKGAYIHLNINSQDYFELKSPYQGDINFTNAAGFKTNSHPITLLNFSWNQTINNNPVVDFGQSVITGTRANSAGVANYYMSSVPFYNFYSPYFYISSGNNPLTLNTADVKADVGYFTTNTPNAFNFGELTIWKDGGVNTGTKVWNFDKLTFLGSSAPNSVSTLTSAGKYKTLYFNPGSYQIENNQTVMENLFMTGTPCNRISVMRLTTGQNIISLDPAAGYTMFYASIRDMNFSRPVSAFGNSQDLGNTNNLTIVPTNVQAAGFGGNKILCAAEFPKTYDASTLFGTDPNAMYTWTKTNTPNQGTISTDRWVTFTQPGNYRVNVTYSQDGCNITENFTIFSVAMPADNTTPSTASAVNQPSGDVQVKFKGSLAQTYIFTYTINNGPDQNITSAANGEAVILHPKNQTGTFIYRLKSIRFANGEACPVVINNKQIVVNINPQCPTPGVMMLMDNVLRGCTAAMGARRLSELNPSTVLNPPADAGVTRLISGTGIVVKEGNDVYMIRNADALPEALVLPPDKPHTQGAIIYHNDHFYEGVENGKWIRVDNE
ncbi:hypothetical protein EGI16_06570 [Chryseobacterium sp. G0240]|uniref:hypothetical protein n=1 Tax=Chryseobacterium sp. G0240 TaxID=2487066 RepID=UPI000F44E6D5|nr:hypothetical protein [Chryseobacterium sp. G0240]ROI04983.1 hypothetical protein EGI16_06570 [Chryseobacterium sp. G0240]